MVDNSFRSDELCLLVLASHLLMNVPENLKNLLTYKQESISHSRWITTASGYLRLLLFNIGSQQMSTNQKRKLEKIVSYIVSVYVPSFVMIHLHPKACDGPFLTLFQRNLLLAYREIQPDVADMVMKYYLDHAGQWLDPQNVALSVYSEVPPYPIEAVKVSSSMPLSIGWFKTIFHIEQQTSSLHCFR